MLAIELLPLRLTADPSRVVIRPFHLPFDPAAETSRARRLVDEVIAMDARAARTELAIVLRDFESRHWQTIDIFMRRFGEIQAQMGFAGGALEEEKKLLIGAYFCQEYSYAAAALTNPSVCVHPDQSGLDSESVRIIMTARAVGEGHISSIAFREGIVARRGLQLMPLPPFAAAAAPSVNAMSAPGEPITVFRNPDSTLSGTVLFPVTPAQSHGLEDLRLTCFNHDDGTHEWIGTYTAYSGRDIQSEMLRTRDFQSFGLVPLAGDANRNKGLALFPRMVGGRYRMIGRMDGENLFLLDSDDLESWSGGSVLCEPRFPWELIQIGNCGSPIEIDQGWLVLMHGVGAMRKYSIGAILLDKDDPAKVLGRTRQPILSANQEDREGYVPNVVYTCGAIRVGGDIFMPYGISDSSIGFAFVPIANLLADMVR